MALKLVCNIGKHIKYSASRLLNLIPRPSFTIHQHRNLGHIEIMKQIRCSLNWFLPVQELDLRMFLDDRADFLIHCQHHRIAQ